MCSRTYHSRRGFTLPEVLATLVLVGVVLPVAMRGISMSLQASERARRVAEAGTLCEQKLNELLVLRDVTYLNGSGDFGADWPDYRWESHGIIRDSYTYDLMVSVTWMKNGQPQTISLTSIVYPETTTQ